MEGKYVGKYLDWDWHVPLLPGASSCGSGPWVGGTCTAYLPSEQGLPRRIAFATVSSLKAPCGCQIGKGVELKIEPSALFSGPIQPRKT